MAGHSKGVAAQIYAKYPKAIYSHCALHRLNLCIASIQGVSNMLRTADSISHFVKYSPKSNFLCRSGLMIFSRVKNNTNYKKNSKL